MELNQSIAICHWAVTGYNNRVRVGNCHEPFQAPQPSQCAPGRFVDYRIATVREKVPQDQKVARWQKYGKISIRMGGTLGN